VSVSREGAQLNPRQGNVFVITTTTSLAFRLTIVSQGGRLVPSVVPLTRPGGIFGRASTTLFSAGEDREGITAVTMEGGNVYMLAGRTVQKWVIGPDGHKVCFNLRRHRTEANRWQFIQDSELYDAVGNALFEDRWSSGNITLDLSDLVGLGSVSSPLLIL
jgi:nuclear pore complex protein Nup133